MKLTQVLAVEQGLKVRVQQAVNSIHHDTQKADLLNGFDRRYTPFEEGGLAHPPENKGVTVIVEDQLARLRTHLVELFDVTATKDWANCSARANIVVDGKTVLADVPATFLLFLEKRLSEQLKLVSEIKTLDAGKKWERDVGSGLYRADGEAKIRTEKKNKPIVLHPPTDKHPAQTQLVVEDVAVGSWNTTYFSGSISHERKIALQTRVQKLHDAVKSALALANSMDIEQQHVGDKLMKFLFGDGAES